ncbi:sigma-70 family RNA polymerase sigma factor [Hydrotalea sp.]|uniref:sigma-70 family RNA polymerase sigma factor n=1 Tax=Hydrotalea sp. TaxID=2881279 RepID=UPI00260660DB|nr:sigma-70 family RNA polymerase sigma factor [Hydrotalea sp.]
MQYQIASYEDETAYKKLFYCVFPSLQNHAFAILQSRQLAEEVVSDVLIEVWKRRATLMEIENLRLYLFVSVRNGAIKKLQQEKKSTRQQPIYELKVELISEYIQPDAIVQLSETTQQIKEAVQQLPPQCKLIYKLAKEDQLKYRDIAALLQISVKTIDHQLAIALKKLAEKLSLPRKQKK